MKRLEFRMQLLSMSAAFLLLAGGLSTFLMSPTQQPQDHNNFRLTARLERLRAVGDLKYHARQQARVLAAQTIAASPVDCVKVACIALTFDDGPNPITTPQVVNILEKEQVSATFFMVGSRVRGNEGLLRKMQADGDEIGNHSWSHPDLTKLTPEQIKQQVQQTQEAIIAAGVPAPTLFRPPYGAINSTVRANVSLTFAFWNEDPKDWAATTASQVLAASEAAAKPGGVIDMHDIYHVTADALLPLIQNLKNRSFHFVTMSQLMGGQPTDGQFFGR